MNGIDPALTNDLNNISQHLELNMSYLFNLDFNSPALTNTEFTRILVLSNFKSSVLNISTLFLSGKSGMIMITDYTSNLAVSTIFSLRY